MMERRAAAVQCEEDTDCVGHAAPASNFSTCKIPPGVWNAIDRLTGAVLEQSVTVLCPSP